MEDTWGIPVKDIFVRIVRIPEDIMMLPVEILFTELSRLVAPHDIAARKTFDALRREWRSTAMAKIMPRIEV